MTFAELVVLLVAGSLLYLFMVPLRRRLEHRLTRYFRSKSPGEPKPVIDITDYKKSKAPKNET